MNEGEKTHAGQRRVPTALAVLLILLCLMGSVYGLWKWLAKNEVKPDVVAIDVPARASASARVRGPTTKQRNQGGRVQKRSDGTIRTSSGNYDLVVAAAGQPREITLRAGNGDEWLNRDQQMILRLAQRVNRGGNAMQTLEITEAQREQMRGITDEPLIALADEDRARMEVLIKTWEGANDEARVEADKAVVLALAEISRKNLAAAKSAYLASIDKLRGMMSPEQLGRFQEMELARKGGKGTVPPVKPATQPTRGA